MTEPVLWVLRYSTFVRQWPESNRYRFGLTNDVLRRGKKLLLVGPIEQIGNVARELEMLDLVFAHRYMRSPLLRL